MTSDTRCLDQHEPTPSNSTEELVRPELPHQPFFFKFSLEWMDRPQWPSKNKRLFAPCLPVGSQLHVQRRRSPAKPSDDDTISEDTTISSEDGHAEENPEKTIDPLQTPRLDQGPKTPRTPTTKNSPLPQLPPLPSYDHLVPSKYAGRALAEWAHIVSECDSFFARRRDEGVPTDRMVETPTLGAETFRK
jgi:hypothetical protein